MAGLVIGLRHVRHAVPFHRHLPLLDTWAGDRNPCQQP